MTLDDIIKELQYNHTSYFHIYGHNIPTSVLSFSASEYINAIGKARSLPPTNKLLNKINTAEVLYKDFVDPTGEDEMTKPFNAMEEKIKEDPLFRGWMKY